MLDETYQDFIFGGERTAGDKIRSTLGALCTAHASEREVYACEFEAGCEQARAIEELNLCQ